MVKISFTTQFIGNNILVWKMSTSIENYKILFSVDPCKTFFLATNLIC